MDKMEDKTPYDYSTTSMNGVTLADAYRNGKQAGYNKALAQLADMAEECKQIGRKDVVEWQRNNPICLNPDQYDLDRYNEKWLAQCGRWGIICGFETCPSYGKRFSEPHRLIISEPKPDESRLVVNPWEGDVDIFNNIRLATRQGFDEGSTAQLAKDRECEAKIASILQAEFKARIEKIKREIEGHIINDGIVVAGDKTVVSDWWQEFWEGIISDANTKGMP